MWRRATAEAFAAFALVFAGCGAIVANDRYDGALGAVGVSLVFGLIIMAMIYATGQSITGDSYRMRRHRDTIAGRLCAAASSGRGTGR